MIYIFLLAAAESVDGIKRYVRKVLRDQRVDIVGRDLIDVDVFQVVREDLFESLIGDSGFHEFNVYIIDLNKI